MVGLISRKLRKKKIKMNTKKIFSLKGSSETTREAFCFDFYLKHKPAHKKNIDIRFLQWFIGFSEGDCNFHTWFERGRKRAGFTLNQDDPKVLFWIRKKLGFGRVLPCGNGWCFQVWDQDGLFRLFCIFSGNLVLDKKYLEFQKWTAFLTYPPGFSYELDSASSQQAKENMNSGNQLIGLNNAWLSGFWQANGGFYAWGCFKSQKIHIVLRAYVIQRVENNALQRIGILIQKQEKKWYRITNNKTMTQYNRLEFASELALETLLKYFKKYPVVGKKHICFLQWKRLWEAREKAKQSYANQIYLDDKLILTEKSKEKLERLVAAVRKQKTQTK